MTLPEIRAALIDALVRVHHDRQFATMQASRIERGELRIPQLHGEEVARLATLLVEAARKAQEN